MHFARAMKVDILFLQECNFRTPHDVKLFKQRFSVHAFFSLNDSMASGVGVVFLSAYLRDKAHVTFGFDGRVIAIDFYLFSRRVRAVNLYAPAPRHLSASFFRSLDMFLLDAYPTFLVGDFNCVVDPERDVRGPGRGRPYRGASALRDLMDQFRLCDAWVHLHGDVFVATWSGGRSASRLDKFLFPPELSGLVESCEVLSFPEEVPRISDHVPVSVKLKSHTGDPNPNLWRMDQCLLTDAVSVAGIRASLVEERDTHQGEADWDCLKAGWRTLLTQAGRERKVRITRDLNETLRRLRIVKSADTVTFAMRDYMDLLKARYERLLRQSSRAASKAFVLGRPVSDPSVLRHVKAGSIDQASRVQVP